MRLYDLSCAVCGWRAPMPVDEEVAEKFRRLTCRECDKAGRPAIKFIIKERIVVGPVQFLPHRKPHDQ